MSKDKRGRPEATSPDPPIEATTERIEATTEHIDTPKAAPAQDPIPAPPVLILGMARLVTQKYGVPAWLTLLAAWTGSKYHAATLGTSNACGIMAEGTQQKNEAGYAWFGNIPIGYDQFGFIARNLDFTDPAACIESLKARLPHIDTVPYTHFTEA